MTLEEQVISLELAKKLKELGVKQESYFWWHFGEKEFWLNTYGGKPNAFTPSISAFTVAELGPMIYLTGHQLPQWNSIDFWDGGTEANARAKCLIYLIEQRILKL